MFHTQNLSQVKIFTLMIKQLHFPSKWFLVIDIFHGITNITIVPSPYGSKDDNALTK